MAISSHALGYEYWVRNLLVSSLLTGKVRLSLKCYIFMMMNSSDVPMLMVDLVFSFISFIHSGTIEAVQGLVGETIMSTCSLVLNEWHCKVPGCLGHRGGGGDAPAGGRGAEEEG